MEKRTILALVLSFIVLITWTYLFEPSQQDTARKEPVHQQGTESVPVVPETSIPVHPGHFEVPDNITAGLTPKADEVEINVDTPLYRAVFSNVGPSIRSFKLKKYGKTIDPDSPLIELVNLKKDEGDFLLISFETNATGQNGINVFQTDLNNIQLGPGSLPKDLVFRSRSIDGLLCEQTFRFYPDQYKIDLKIDVRNQSDRPVTGIFGANIKAMPLKKKKSYYSFSGLALLLNNKLKEVKIKKPTDPKTLSGQIGWVAYENDFFISSIILDQSSDGIFKGQMLKSGILEGRYIEPPVVLRPSENIDESYSLYLGPRDLGILKKVGNNLEKAVNFGWTDVIAKPLLHLLRFFNQYINNYGLSIILITFLIKTLFWPLTDKSYKSMKDMKKLQPMMAKLREKYKNDKVQLNKEMMGLYKTYKINPMGGCLPMIIQIPVFFALFRILGSAIELRHAPFFLWINDLSAPDRLFNLPFKIPFMKPPYGIPVLTLLMGASMFLQQKMTPTPGDPAQAKIMMFLPVIFTFMFINFPSGLVLYWLVNNILSIGQQYRINKRPS